MGGEAPSLVGAEVGAQARCNRVPQPLPACSSPLVSTRVITRQHLSARVSSPVSTCQHACHRPSALVSTGVIPRQRASLAQPAVSASIARGTCRHGTPGRARQVALDPGSYLRLIDFCITQLQAQGPSRTCNESKEVNQRRDAQVKPDAILPASAWLWPAPALYCIVYRSYIRKVDVMLLGKGNSNSHGARPVHLIITMIK